MNKLIKIVLFLSFISSSYGFADIKRSFPFGEKPKKDNHLLYENLTEKLMGLSPLVSWNLRDGICSIPGGWQPWGEDCLREREISYIIPYPRTQNLPLPLVAEYPIQITEVRS